MAAGRDSVPVQFERAGVVHGQGSAGHQQREYATDEHRQEQEAEAPAPLTRRLADDSLRHLEHPPSSENKEKGPGCLSRGRSLTSCNEPSPRYLAMVRAVVSVHIVKPFMRAAGTP